jgi:CRP-like cAMP-binding protein
MPLTVEESNAIVKLMHIQEYKKGTILLKEGQISANTYLVFIGCVRLYYLVDEEEITNYFYFRKKSAA